MFTEIIFKGIESIFLLYKPVVAIRFIFYFIYIINYAKVPVLSRYTLRYTYLTIVIAFSNSILIVLQFVDIKSAVEKKSIETTPTSEVSTELIATPPADSVPSAPLDCELKLEERRLYLKRRGLPYLKSGALTHMDGEQLLKRKAAAKLGHASFLQETDCLNAAPKLLKCRECKAGQKSGNIFCRFYAFRRFVQFPERTFYLISLI